MKSDNMWSFVIFSVSIIFSRFLHVVVRISISFLFLLNNAPLHEFHLIYPFISRWTFRSGFCEPWAPSCIPRNCLATSRLENHSACHLGSLSSGSPSLYTRITGRRKFNVPMPRLHPRPITAASLGGGPRHQPLSSSQVVTSTANCESHSVSV